MSEATVKNIDPTAAWEILQADPSAVLIDVRTKMEYDYVGHPPIALHVFWAEWPDWTVNPNFVAEVKALLQARPGQLSLSTPVLTLCRSGTRSLAAGQLLADAGFAQVYNVDEGFEGERDLNKHRNAVNGWRARGLPWEQT